jgi:hypothetical protein
LARKVIRRLLPRWRRNQFYGTPLWYPLALRFKSAP